MMLSIPSSLSSWYAHTSEGKQGEMLNADSSRPPKQVINKLELIRHFEVINTPRASTILANAMQAFFMTLVSCNIKQ